MGNINQKEIDDTYNVYSNAYEIFDERIHRIPIKYMINILIYENNWNILDVYSLLLYLSSIYALTDSKNAYLRYNEVNAFVKQYKELIHMLF